MNNALIVNSGLFCLLCEKEFMFSIAGTIFDPTKNNHRDYDEYKNSKSINPIDLLIQLGSCGSKGSGFTIFSGHGNYGSTILDSCFDFGNKGAEKWTIIFHDLCLLSKIAGGMVRITNPIISDKPDSCTLLDDADREFKDHSNDFADPDDFIEGEEWKYKNE